MICRVYIKINLAKLTFLSKIKVRSFERTLFYIKIQKRMGKNIAGM